VTGFTFFLLLSMQKMPPKKRRNELSTCNPFNMMVTPGKRNQNRGISSIEGTEKKIIPQSEEAA